MSQYLEKRTYDGRLYDFPCAPILATGETITTINSITADQGGLIFGTPVKNSAPITYPDGSVAAIGTVIQVEISAGTIPTGSDSIGLGVPNLLCTVRARFNTSISPNQLEATALILLKDQPT